MMMDLFYSCYLYSSDMSTVQKLPELASLSLAQPSPPSLWRKPLTIATAEYDAYGEEGDSFRPMSTRRSNTTWPRRSAMNDHHHHAQRGGMERKHKGSVASKDAFALTEKSIKNALSL
ncbi:hypothetical protein K437DRAFT_277040 [Tilletiaria anomala UBC 951]|uniref:Uncharacterized protein n=1 Tax=Tilletiaria anomala (strain ATCC 24038 / CBS 436.72 / UBC 951) TaxID=1037660 RepID=A0A066V7T9_TILAU|nr:uncharacterized protein K437DRAFT_277040 [Tilletiaria anomala UBC 951]KDN34695.1 hypothetical protein K437DRAFT_277040 [Tilletiaria anomala UBC 951]